MEKLAQVKGGLVIERQADDFNSRHNELSSRTRRIELVGADGWLARNNPDGGQGIVSWCDGKEFGIFSSAYLLGRVRASNKNDLQHPPLELADASTTLLHVTYADYTPTVEGIAKDRVVLILKQTDPKYETRFVIDTERHVVLSVEERRSGKVTGTTKFDDFVQIAGSWWARRVETFGEKGQRLSLTTQTITELPGEEFGKRMTQELATKRRVLFLRQPLPTVVDAKKAATGGKATFDDQAVLTLHFAASQQWTRARQHYEECERLAGGKPGMRWLRNAFLLASRRHEELRKSLLEEAAGLAKAADRENVANDWFLAEQLIGQAQQVLAANESLGILDRLQKLSEQQPAHVQALKTWNSRRHSLLQQAGQSDKALSLLKSMAADYPHDHNIQWQYAQNVAASGIMRPLTPG